MPPARKKPRPNDGVAAVAAVPTAKEPPDLPESELNHFRRVWDIEHGAGGGYIAVRIQMISTANLGDRSNVRAGGSVREMVANLSEEEKADRRGRIRSV